MVPVDRAKLDVADVALRLRERKYAEQQIVVAAIHFDNKGGERGLVGGVKRTSRKACHLRVRIQMA